MTIAEITEQSERRGAPCTLAVLIPQRLRNWRKAQGKTLVDVAARMNTTPQTAQRLETGNMPITLNWLDRMCRAYEIDQRSLFLHEGDPELDLQERARKLGAEARLLHAHTTNFMVYLNDLVEAL
jgi:transcriptional regulator with XRE-family HTH domain